MKRIIITTICLLWSFLSYGQENYVKSYTARDTIKTSLKTISDHNRVQQSIQYLDGLGRPVQSIVRQGSPLGKDVVSFQQYDDYGRSLKQFLPFVRQTTTGGISANSDSLQRSFYGHQYDTINGQYAFAEAEVETSPLARPLRQGAQGVSWQLSGNHTVDMEYRVNDVDDEIRKLVIVGDSIMADTDYPVGELMVNITKDENTGIKEGETRVFTDKSGRTLVKMVKSEDGFLSTVYIYDDYGNLRHVISPEGMRRINGSSFDWDDLNDDSFRKNWLFSYRYDDRNRMVAKRVPGSDWMYMIYDNRDRLVLTQDGNQGLGDVERVDGELVIDRYMGKSYKLNSGAKLKIKPVSGKFTFSSSPGKKFKASFSDFTANQKWIFTKYDELDRPVATGFYYDSDPIDSVRAKVAAITDFEESFTGTGAMQGYDNTAFPSNVSGEDLLSVTYYDDYVFHNEPARPKAKGLPTGAKTRVLGTDKWLTSITYYDDRLRPISMVTDNHLSGQDIVNTTYRNAISGIVLETEMIHSSKYLSQPLKTVETYTYDHMDRLLTVDQEIFEGTTSKGTVRLVTNTYDELGRLQAKDLNSGAQTIDYEYNIRGWLTKLNNGTDLMGTDQFGMQLKYDSAGQYNGNIGQMSWRNLGGSVNSNKAVQTFTYSYDPLNRLNSAIYSNAGKNNHFNVSGITYDGNGNIKTLSRRENNAILDLLIYRYDGKGNQLTGVDDGGDKVNGFKDDTSDIGDEYSYDANGNMILDLNKEISSISYNHLNLPEVVRFESGKYVKYQYDAAGIKLQKIAGLPDTNGNIVETTTDYVGGKHYVNGALEFFQHAEGRVVTSGGTYAYEFNLTDHLGNVRASVDANGNVIQRDDYYPFGSTFQHFNIGDENQYKFNGNEVQVEIPNTADFNARFYDNSLGRFMMVDPLADDPKQLDQSPYQFGWNNPTNLNDPTGLKPGMCCGNWEVRINKRMNPGNYNHEIPPALENSWQFKTIKYGLMGMVAIPTAIYTGEYIAANYVNLLFNPVVHNEVAAGIYGAFMDDEWAVPAVSDNATRGLRRLAGHGVLDVTKLGDDGYRIGGRLVKEGIRSIGDVKITNEGISTIKSHLSRPELDFAAGNEVMIGRLEQIFSGKLKATEQDLYFYSHELTEYNLMNQGYSYDEAHSVAAKAYGVKAKEEVDTFYTQEAQKASDDYFLNNLDK